MAKRAVRIDVDELKLLPPEKLEIIQGDLKDLPVASYNHLRDEIDELGFSFAIHAWPNPKTKRLEVLDGTQRLRTILKMREEGFDCPKVPVAIVRAKSRKEAARKLLGGAGAYGKPSSQGLYEFMHAFGIEPIELERIELPGIDVPTFRAEYFEEPSAGGKTDDDSVPEPPKVARTKRGELWMLGEHRLLCGDCTETKDVKKLFGKNFAELCFTSPPYSDQRDYSGNLELDPKHLAKFLSAPARIFAVNLGIQKRSHEIVAYWDAYLEHAKALGLKLLSWNVWDKMQSGSVGHQCMMFPLEHEWIFIFGKEPKALNATEETVWGGKGKTGASRNKDGTIQVRPKKIVGMKKPIGTVLRHFPEKARNHGFDHPAMFPVGFPQKYVEACTARGEIVYEPFSGSGSTLIACQKTGRRFFGIEIDPIYVDIILQRWADYTGEDPVREDGKRWSKLSS